jgi:hypothetical protein
MSSRDRSKTKSVANRLFSTGIVERAVGLRIEAQERTWLLEQRGPRFPATDKLKVRWAKPCNEGLTANRRTLLGLAYFLRSFAVMIIWRYKRAGWRQAEGREPLCLALCVGTRSNTISTTTRSAAEARDLLRSIPKAL